MDRAGGEDGAAGLYPLALEVQECGARCGDGDDVCLTNCLFEILLDDGFNAVCLADMCRQLLCRSEGVVIADDLLDLGHLGDHVVKAGGTDSAAADAQQDFRVLASKIAGRNAGNGTGACGAEQVCAHVSDGFAGVLIIKGDHQDAARQALLLVCGVRAVPLLAADIESAAEISGHCDEAAVGAGDGHIGELAFLGEYDVHAVVIVVIAAHEIIALCKQGEHLFCIIYALSCIQNACCDGVGLGHVKELCFMSHDGSPFG